MHDERNKKLLQAISSLDFQSGNEEPSDQSAAQDYNYDSGEGPPIVGKTGEKKPRECDYDSDYEYNEAMWCWAEGNWMYEFGEAELGIIQGKPMAEILQSLGESKDWYTDSYNRWGYVVAPFKKQIEQLERENSLLKKAAAETKLKIKTNLQ